MGPARAQQKAVTSAPVRDSRDLAVAEPHLAHPAGRTGQRASEISAASPFWGPHRAALRSVRSPTET